MQEQSINEYLKQRRELLEAEMARLLQKPYPGAERLFAAMEYSLMAGGKRLRPLLFLAAAEGFAAESRMFPGENGPVDFLPFACGIEMLHTYSLIHDDLPAMDNDDLRRGRPSCHKQFDEATAILAGDGLLTHCFAVMLSSPLPPADLVRAVQYFAQNAGVYGMVAGQIMDIAAEGKAIDAVGLQAVHRAKTGALLAASVVCGGILAGADAAEQQALEQFGLHFGMAFQIIDDILDVAGDKSVLGKPVGSDAANGKITYVSLLGPDEARRQAAEYTSAAVQALAPLGAKGGRLAQIAEYCLERKY